MRPNIAGGMQDPRLNRGGPGNPGTVHNTGYSAPSNYRTARYQRDPYAPSSPYYGSGQRPDLGRYRPPTMEGNNWNDTGGYAYNLPNSYGPRPDFGEFNSPYAPSMGRRGGGTGNMMGGGFGGGRPNFRDMLARLAEMGGMTAGPYGAGGEQGGAGSNGLAPGQLPPGAVPSPVGGYMLNGQHYQSDHTPVGATAAPKPGQDSGYKGPDAVDQRPDALTDPEGFNYWTHRNGMVPDVVQPIMPEFRSQEDFDNWRWGNRRPSYWPQG